MIHCNSWLILLAVGGLFTGSYLLGQVVLMRFKKEYRHYFAPVVGYGVYAYILYVLMHVTTDPWILGGVTLLLFGGSLYVCIKHKNYPPKIYAAALAAGALIAVYVTYIMWVKTAPDGSASLLAPSYDHIKTAITSSIVNTGLPVVNPFCAVPARLAYYFLYYVPSAAQALMLGMSSYEAEVSSAILVVFVSFLALFGTLAVVRQKECDAKAIALCTLLAATGCMHTYLPFLSPSHGFDSIVTTLVWTPQTLLAVACLLVVIVLIHLHRMKPVLLISFLLAVILGLSVYIAIVAVAGLGLYFIIDMRTNPSPKEAFKYWVSAGVLSFCFSLGFIVNQTGGASGQFPIAFHIYPWSLGLNPLLEIAGFWTLYCFLQMPMLVLLNAWKLRRDILKQYAPFYVMIFVSLFITCFLKTTIDSNDLGWRAILVAIVLLTVLAAHWFFYIKSKAIRVAIVVLAIVCISTPYNKLNSHVRRPSHDIRSFSAQSIAAIRQYITVNDAFLNNIWGRNTKAWSANIDVMIGLQRNSCYASWGSVKAYCDRRLRPAFELVRYIFWNKEIPEKTIPTARAIGCTKFLFYRTDPNFNNEAELQRAGLRKIYQNDEIKIYE